MEIRPNRRPKRWALYLKFGITGILNTATDFLVLNVLLSALGAIEFSETIYLTAKSVSFLVAVTQSYILNKYWVFDHVRHVDRPKVKETGSFLAISLAGLVLNITTSTLVFTVLKQVGFLDTRSRANIGAIAGTLLVLSWNYLGYRLFVFTDRQGHETEKKLQPEQPPGQQPTKRQIVIRGDTSL